jgi:hypothetical protein
MFKECLRDESITLQTYFDITGRQVVQVPVTGEKTVLQSGELAPGIYLHQINTSSFIVTGNFMISK